MRTRNKRKRRGLTCELPYEIMGGGTRIMLYAKQSVVVEGHNGVLRMERDAVCFKSACGVIAIRGCELKIRELSLDTAIVTGASIESVAYDEENDRGGDSSGRDV